MFEIVDIKSKVVSKEDFNKIFDTSFNTFVDETSQVVNLSIPEFFSEYERLFNQIDINGTTNSHEYIFNRSGKFFNYEKDTQDIQPLLDEIALLRRQLLGSIAFETAENSRLDDQMDSIQQALTQAISLPSTPSPSTPSTGGGGGTGINESDIIEVNTSSDGNTGRINP